MGKKGFKVKRSKSLYNKKKSTLRKALETAGLIVVIGGLCLLGFAAGRPVFEYFSGENTRDADWQTTTPTLPNSDDEPLIDDTEDQSLVESATTHAAGGLSFFAPVSALENKAALSATLITAKSDGYTSVVVDLKDSTGNVWYKSANPKIQSDEFIKGNLELAEIFSIFEENSMEPIARISTLADRIAPRFLDEVSYWFADSSSKWLDDRLESGGKFWADPTRAGTVSYISELTDEIRAAGFDKIILSNVLFPIMRPYDLSILPSNVTQEGRYSALVELVNQCAPVEIEMQLMDIAQSFGGFSGTAEILKGASSLSENIKIVAVFTRQEDAVIRTSELNSVPLPTDIEEQVGYLFDLAVSNAGGIEIIPCVDRTGMSDAETARAIEAARAVNSGVMVK
ncbi:MAG: putative glycoside hydrolase [Oscillospiraceae bacterium]|nr:putative glycoside hydrolase [Oscillospiraceae bacterium]